MEYQNEHDQIEFERVRNLKDDIRAFEMRNSDLAVEVETAERTTEMLLGRLCELYDALERIK